MQLDGWAQKWGLASNSFNPIRAVVHVVNLPYKLWCARGGIKNCRLGLKKLLCNLAPTETNRFN